MSHLASQMSLSSVPCVLGFFDITLVFGDDKSVLGLPLSRSMLQAHRC